MQLCFHLCCKLRIDSAMNLDHLRTFLLIADSGGISKAANRLHLSQPAASRQILALEAELGVQLFGRIGRGLQLTSEGQDLLVRCRRLLDDAESLRDRARALNTAQTGLLRVGAPPQVIESILAGFVEQYRQRHPNVDIQLIDDAAGNLPGRLERGELHLMEVPSGNQRYPAQPLYPGHMLVVMRRQHRLARKGVVDVQELAGEPLLLLRPTATARTWVDAAFNVANVDQRIMLESTVPHTLIALAITGYGMAIVPSNVIIPREHLRAIPLVLHGEPIGRWAVISWHPDRFLPPYARKFVEDLVPYALRHHPGRDLIRRAPPLTRPKATAL
jgi:LysR family cyn operon transcriptional activator